MAAIRDVAWYPLYCPCRRAVRTFSTARRFARRFERHRRCLSRFTTSRLFAIRSSSPRGRGSTRARCCSPSSGRDACAGRLGVHQAGVVELAGVPADRIDVAYNATSAAVFTPDGPASPRATTSSRSGRSSRARICRADRGDRQARARIAGRRRERMGRCDVDAPHVRWLGRPTDDELAAELRGALCLAYPSLLEGFGIPVSRRCSAGRPW